MLVTVTIAAGETKEFREECDYFRILSSSGTSVDLVFIRDGAVLSDAAGISPGYSEEWTRPIDTVRITAQTTQTLKFVMRIGSKVNYDVPPGGTLVFPAAQGPYTSTAPAIAVTSTSIAAANTGRKKIEIQNNDPAITIWVNFSGVAAVAAPPSIKIGPGGSYSEQNYPPTGQIFAIAVTTANPLITVLEG